MDDASSGWNAVAAEFIACRSSIVGVAAVRKWAAALPSGSSILDLGCGHGAPISAALVKDGFSVYGIDASPDLVSEFQRSLPGIPIRCEGVETSTFFDRQFDAVIAIGLMFLLHEDAQRQLILKASAALRRHGRFLFTAPAQEVAWADILTGRQSRSLGYEAYAATLKDVGFNIVGSFTDEGENHYYSATRSVQPAA